MEIINDSFELGGIPIETLIQNYGSPIYVYEESILRSQFRQLRDGFPENLLEIHYAMKANSNPALLKILCEEGCSIDAVSEFEVRLALDSGFAREKILFTGNNNTMLEIDYCLSQEIPVNLGSLAILERYGETYPSTKVSVRINPGIGAGHHAHCITGGPDSKFGIYYDQINKALALAKKHDLTINGVHSHIGTGIYSAAPMLEAMEMTLNVAQQFPDLEFVDFGGGFGIPYRPEQDPLDMEDLNSKMTEKFQAFIQTYGRSLQMKIEPGRLLVGPAGTLLVTVTNITNTPNHRFVGVDSGFNHLVRPTMYGAYHKIKNASRIKGEEKSVVIVGYICESGDIFSRSGDQIARSLISPEIGDHLLILDAGAYGMSMSSQYNSRPRPAEVLVNEGKSRLIRREETYQDLRRCFDELN